MLHDPVDVGHFFNVVIEKKRQDIKPGFYDFVNKLFSHQISVFILILGRRGTGKTDFALLLAELAYALGIIKHVATNTKVFDSPFPIEHIDNLQDLEYWGKTNTGRKLFVFDEIADAMSRRRPMAALTVELIKKFNKLRKHKLSIASTTISEDVLDNAAMNRDLLDAVFRRPYFNEGNPNKCKKAYYVNTLNGRKKRFNKIPKTSVHFDSWDASPFTDKPIIVKPEFKDKDMELIYRWSKGETYEQLGVHPQQLTRAKKKIIPILIDAYLHGSH